MGASAPEEQKVTWHLKDRELEKKFVELFPCFLEELDEGVYQQSLGKDDVVGVDLDIATEKCGSITIQMQIDIEDIENELEYCPYDWNEFPKTMPPRNVWMRVEGEDGYGVKAEWDGRFWQDSLGHRYTFAIVRFRPWED